MLGVKQQGSTATNGFVYLEKIIPGKNGAAPQARISFDVKTASGTKQTSKLIGEGTDLFEYSEGLEEYRHGYIIDRIDGVNGFIHLLNDTTLYEGEMVGSINEKLIRRIQILLVTWFLWRWLASFSQEGLRDYIQSFGAAGWIVFLVLQILQVFIALIPGELLESVAGFVFGPVFGTLLCYAGVAIASSMVFVLTRKFGVKLVEVFISREKINQLRFLNTEKKRDLLIFLAFFIPGTPKDLLTYFVGLTEIRLGAFLAISLVARIPSVVTSTFGGHLLGEGEYVLAIVIYALTAVISLLGMLGYNAWMKRRENKEE